MWLVGGVVRRYIDILIIIINFPYSTCIRSFFGSSILTSLFIFKMFFLSYIYMSNCCWTYIYYIMIYLLLDIYNYIIIYIYVQLLLAVLCADWWPRSLVRWLWTTWQISSAPGNLAMGLMVGRRLLFMRPGDT